MVNPLSKFGRFDAIIVVALGHSQYTDAMVNIIPTGPLLPVTFWGSKGGGLAFYQHTCAVCLYLSLDQKSNWIINLYIAWRTVTKSVGHIITTQPSGLES